MWRSISLRNRLNLIFASLFALWLVADAIRDVWQASGRSRVETQSAMRLTKDFVATTLAVSSYPFDPLPTLGGIFLVVFAIVGGTMILIYAQMHRDATLSYITGSEPGELGGEFWRQLFTFGVGPPLGLLTTLFPSITDFVVSWLQPSSQAIK